MKLLALLIPAIGTWALQSDARDRDGAVWQQPQLAKRQSTWNPPASLVKPLQEVWDRRSQSENVYAFKNYGYDIIIAAKGHDYASLHVCSTANSLQEPQLLCPMGVGGVSNCCSAHGHRAIAAEECQEMDK